MCASSLPKHVAILLTLITVGTASLGMFRLEIIDDAYITFRVARNLADGLGYTYNAGQRIEASTSLTWPLILALFYKFTNGIPAIAASLGALFAASALLIAYGAARKLECSDAASVAGVAVIALTPQYWLAAASGLEGGLYTMLLALTIATAGERMRLSALIGGLLFATRPEGAAVFAILALLSAWPAVRAKKLHTLAAPLAIWLAIVGGITAWRLIAFGSPLPNSVIAKSVPVTAATISMGTFYLGQFSTVLPHWVALAGLSVLFVRCDWRFTAVLAIVAVQIPIILRNGGDWMPHFRLLAQYGPAIAILGALTLDRLCRASARRWIAAPLLATIAGAAAIGLVRENETLNSWRRPTFDLSIDLPAGGYGTFAKSLRSALVDGDLFAPEAIGRFGDELYRARIHDFLGLADPIVAWNGDVPAPPFGKTHFRHTLDCAPTMFVFHSGDFHPNAIRRQDDRLDAAYAGFELPPLGLTVYIRRDSLNRFASVLAAHHAEPALVK